MPICSVLLEIVQAMQQATTATATATATAAATATATAAAAAAVVVLCGVVWCCAVVRITIPYLLPSHISKMRTKCASNID